MTGSTFANLLRKTTYTDTTTFPNADIITFANSEKDDLAEFLTDQVGEDFFQLQFTRNLESGKREYSLPREVLIHIKRVTAKLDGTNNVLLHEFDLNDVQKALVSEADIQAAFAGKQPAYDIIDIGIKIYNEDAITAVTSGLTLDTIIYPEDIGVGELSADTDLSIASSTTTTRLPKAAHLVWLLKTSIAYKESRPKPIKLNKREENIEYYIERMIANLRGRNLDRSYTPGLPADNGFGY